MQICTLINVFFFSFNTNNDVLIQSNASFRMQNLIHCKGLTQVVNDGFIELSPNQHFKIYDEKEVLLYFIMLMT